MKFTQDEKTGVSEMEYSMEEQDEILADINAPFHRDHVLVRALKRYGLLDSEEAACVLGSIIDRLIENR